MKTVKYWMLLLSLIAMISCNNSEMKEDAGTLNEEKSAAQVTAKFQNVDSAFRRQMNQVVQHYIHLKNALVKSDHSEAKAAAGEILKAISGIDSSKITVAQKTEYLAAVQKIRTGAQLILESAVVEKQRENFNTVTGGTYALIRSFSVGKEFFYEYCPMANNNNGGYWISESSEVNNPYFGDEMPHCGEVKEVIK